MQAKPLILLKLYCTGMFTGFRLLFFVPVLDFD